MSNKRLLAQLGVSLGLLAAALAVFVYRQAIVDTYTVQQFQPAAAVQSITQRTKLTDKGRFLFYASQPQLDDRASFNKACTLHNTEQSVVLGCYVATRIYVFDIDNPKLDGIKEVTAAHEMLHAAYDRLSSSERGRVDGLVEAQLKTISDERILGLIKEYDKTEPGQRLNELHSILGTEVRSLSPELETYYSQYFKDRSAVVALAEGYSAVFTQLKTRSETLVAEINALADGIETRNSNYAAAADQLNKDIAAFNVRARSGQMTGAEYDSERSVLEGRQASLRAAYDAIKADIALYNSKRAELETVSTEAEVLNRSIDSKVSPVPNL